MKKYLKIDKSLFKGAKWKVKVKKGIKFDNEYFEHKALQREALKKYLS
jgi:hypothetical protein